MKQILLDGEWTLDLLGSGLPNGDSVSGIKADIPGSVYSALLSAKLIDDPYWRDNELEALKIMDNDFLFNKTFDLNMPAGYDKIVLICQGLDTICGLELNGVHIGNANNMHRTWEFDITDAAKAKGNMLKITIASPTRFIAERDKELFTDGSEDAMRGFPQIRKAHCMFGWDWGPRLPDAGIWRSISIAFVEKGRIENVYITQKHENGKVELNFDVTCDAPYEVAVTAPDGSVLCSDGSTIIVGNPELWWPNGYGAQPLYTVRVSSQSDEWERRIGLRTMAVKREKDEWGESFAHEINGIAIFAMGADYIPEDNLFSRITPERTRKLLEDCIAANFNCIRIWGGGYYPDDFFYDICDELGLIVWQDFMFACAIYELTPEFDANIRAEIADNVKRLRHHASLALWCGNNELEWQYGNDTYRTTPKQKADYFRIFEYIIQQEVASHDPQTFYWPASPSSGGGFDDPNDFNRGDTHYWDVWHEMKPFSDYRKHFFRYASEFGFQSFPELKTVKAFTEESDRNIFSRVMEMHQRNRGANGRIMYYISMMYKYPYSFEHLLYASQLLQADAIRYGVEHWRRHRGRCMGAVYWQINDIWPVVSWSSVDYFGRWKALHYYAKRFFAPVMLSCCETGEMTERPSCVMQPGPIKKAARLSVANETLKNVSGTVKWALRDPIARVLKSGEIAVTVDALSSKWLDELDFSDCSELSNYFSYELYADGKIISGGTALFCMPKHFAFENPELSVAVNGDEITVTAKAYAKSVELYSNSGDFVLSDNFFDMNAGSVTVKVLRGDVRDVRARSVADIGYRELA